MYTPRDDQHPHSSTTSIRQCHIRQDEDHDMDQDAWSVSRNDLPGHVTMMLMTLLVEECCAWVGQLLCTG